MEYVLDNEKIKLFNTKITGDIDGLSKKIQIYFEKYDELKKVIQEHKISYDINF